jgi:hypothetical protein
MHSSTRFAALLAAVVVTVLRRVERRDRRRILLSGLPAALVVGPLAAVALAWATFWL